MKVAKPLNKAGEISVIDAAMAPFLDSHALARRLPELAALREEFVARCEGRFPPGYEDLSKSADRAEDEFSGANRFGDYVFWRSIVEHAAEDASIRTAIIISHDAKRDWVHVPDRYVGYGEAATSNNKKGSARVTCPHPALAFELRVEAEVEQLFIVSIMQLVRAFSLTGGGGVFKELARAIQIEDVTRASRVPDEPAASEAGAGEAQAKEPEQPLAGAGVGPAGGGEAAEAEGGNAPPVIGAAPVAVGVRARLEALPDQAIADGGYVEDPDGNPDADAIIVELRTRNWYVQNPAVARLGAIVDDPSTSDVQLFVLGRNLYQSACGNAYRAMELLPNLVSLNGPVRDDALPMLFAGLLFEAYFDRNGALRALPKDDQLEPLFLLAHDAGFNEVVRWLHDRLGAQALQRLPLVPGGAREALLFEIAFDAAGGPTEIAALGVPVSEAAQPDEDLGWDPEALPARVVPERLVQLLARHLRLPDERIRIQPEWEDERNFGRLRLKPWSTGGELTFPADQLAQDA